MGEGKRIGIAEARKQAGFTIEQMSRLIGVTEQRMIEFENDPGKLSTRMAGKITKAVGRGIDDIDFTINAGYVLCDRCPFGVR
ncbi:DNA-binding XRE family transcriptional regulator [Paenibacillus sp. 4624]|uniref:helix-turn-helix transcriptional regulator n=1 Tax=Paenibacillus sp. 4624 TaxID=3156453 RepID=UPI003D1B089A